MSVSFKTAQVAHVSQAEWAELAPGFSDLSYRQGPSYVAQAARASRASAEFVLLRVGETLIGAGAVRVMKIPGLPIGVAYLLHSPLTVAGGSFDPQTFFNCVDALVRHYVEERSLALRIVPPLAAANFAREIGKQFERRGFEDLKRPARQTLIVPTNRDAAQIRRSLDQKWRNMLSKSERSGVDVVLTNDPNEFRSLSDLLDDLERKKEFRAAHNVAFFERVQRFAPSYEQLALHLARLDGRVVAAHLGSFAGDTSVYLLGASGEEGRRVSASYLLQWKVIERSVKLGKHGYDLGGVDPVQNPNVYRFKKGMSGVEISEVGVFQRAPSAALATAIALLERARDRWRGRR